MSKETTEIYKFGSHKEWHEGLQEAPNSKWIKSRSLGGNKSSSYIPLGIQEAVADIFFREFDLIDITYEVCMNEIIAIAKFSILPNYPHSEHRIICGSSAKPIQCRKGSSFPAGKISNALEYNTPASQSAAKSNALTNFANIFGRNLNRKEIPNGFSYTKKKKEDEN